jgi:hypothetical protein
MQHNPIQQQHHQQHFQCPSRLNFLSLKSIIIASRDNTSVASGNVNGFFPHSSNKFQLNQAYFRIIKSCW